MTQPRPPDFLCIGAAKTGTTWLYNMLSACPGYWMPPTSELRYFGRKEDFVFGADTLETMEKYPCKSEAQLEWMRHYVNGSPKDDAWYLELFSDADEAITGDISPNYGQMVDRHIQSAKRLVPNATVIMFVRNPIDRAISHAIHIASQKIFRSNDASVAARTLGARMGFCGEKAELTRAFMRHFQIPWMSRSDLNMILGVYNAAEDKNVSFGDILKSSELRIPVEAIRESLNEPSLTRQNQQSLIIKKWREVFGRQFHIFAYDDLISDPAAFLASVTSTLGRTSAPTDSELLRKPFNTGFYEACDGVDEMRAEIASHFAAEIAELRELLGERVDVWTRPSQP